MSRYKHLPVDPGLNNLKKALRKNPTPRENHLRYDFLSSYQPRFTGQKNIGNYIVDFYCAKANPAIELGGSRHYDTEKKKQDDIRTFEPEKPGVKVIRFSERLMIASL